MKDLLSDETFLARWLSGELTEEEAAAFAAHPDREHYERLARTGSQLQPPAYDPEAELARLLQRRKELVPPAPPEAARKPLIAVRYRAAAAAAVLVLLAAAWLLWPTGADTYSAGAGELVAQQLRDGSMVQLNAGSELTFDVGEARSARLAGEAFFNVEKSSVPFVVATAEGTVTVLGTSFNVYTRNATLRVACVTGKVRVAFNGVADAFDLAAGQAVVRSGTEEPVSMPHEAAETMDYLDGWSVFDKASLREVLDEVERQFGLNIILPPTINQRQTITTAFHHDDAVDDVLKSVLNPLPDTTFELEGNTVKVKTSRTE